MSDTTDAFEEQFQPIEIQEEMERSFLDYSMSVIVSRALPDARDGLKPVHRRILWGMYDLGARPDRPTMKCARVTGEVMGKYHPHGDSAIYDALVRMGQSFSLRHPLVHPKGNFGTPDDPPAAARYCVSGDTLVQTTDGTVRIDELGPALPDSELDLDVKVLDRRGRPVRASKLFHSGLHQTLRVRTREGYEVTGTANHPLLCLDSVAGVPMLLWLRIDELRPGVKVVLRRDQDPEFGGWLDDDEHALALLSGAFVAEGFVSDERAGFNNVDRDYFDAVLDAYDRVVGGPRYVYDRVIRSGSRIHELDVQRLGHLLASPLGEMVGRKSAAKEIPSYVLGGSLDMKRVFLKALFEGDGCVTLAPRSSIRVSYCTYSPVLARQIQVLLLEFGIASRLGIDHKRGAHVVSMNNRRDARLFAARVGFLGAKQQRLIDHLDQVPSTSRAMSGDHVPFLAEYVRAEAGRGGLEWLKKHNIDRVERWEHDGEEILDHIANPEVRAVIEPLVECGYYYATVASVDDAGVQPVYSIRVESEDHSFLTNGFISHNTECRLAPIAMDMLAGIEEDTVDFVDNYSGEFREPVLLPSRFPNLLVNGSQGIAVGMATNIPPHNLGEVIDATVHLLQNPDATPDDLMEFVKGPDFPTGGLMMGRQGILDAYRTGRGSIRLRAVAEIEEGRTNDTIVVTQLPYQVSPSSVLGKIEELVRAGELDGIADLNNASSGDAVRLEIKLKRDAPALVVLNNLYKRTPLQTSFGVNTVALIDGVPRTLNLRDALQAYIDHQVDVIRRRSEFRLAEAKRREHIVEGLVKALDMIDAIIALIRGSADRAEARAGLMGEGFEFSEIQANHILDMTLGRLTRLGRQELEEELAKLRETIAELEAILADEGKLRGVIRDELGEIREAHASPRQTELTYDVGDIDIEDLIDDEELVVTLTAKGYVKTVAAGAFRTQGRGGRGVAGTKLRDEDYVTNVIHTTAHAYLLLFSNRGKVYRLKAHEIPMKERTARGTAVVNLLPLQPGETIQAIIDTRDYETSRFLFFATKQGQVKKTKFTEYDSSRRDGIIAINLRDDDELVKVIQTDGETDIFLVSKQGQTIRFKETEVRPMGRSAAGVRGMKLREGDEVMSVDVGREGVALLTVTDSGFGKRTMLDKFPTKGRGTMGVKGMKITQRRGTVISALMVSLDDDIILISSAGTVIRMACRQISAQGRDASGVKVMNVGPDELVAAVALVSDQESEDS